MENESYVQPSAWKRPLIVKLTTTRSTVIRGDEAQPPVILGRPGCAPPDYFPEVLLHDLVEPGVWLDLELKKAVFIVVGQ